jgi:predicted nucleic acid-binding protein
MNAVKAEVFRRCTREALLAELRDVLSRDKFGARLQQAQLAPQGIVDDLRRLATVVSPIAVPRVVAADADDGQVLAAALASRADPIASGDKRHLLPLGSYAGIEIVAARQALGRIAARA